MNTACVYKIFCKDATITDFYVGSTTNFVKRVATHKSHCNNKNNSERPQYNTRLCIFIRQNGGFENWNFEILEMCDKGCEKNIEDKYIKQLNPTLNSNQWAIRTLEEQRNRRREYYHNNKYKYLDTIKEWQLENREKINARKRELYAEKKQREQNIII